ncbi:Sodium/calcium exchanger protein-domain-containing protein [Cantharellus anzutake]|uniref:Sodium/calcium exchanger protein-domain-containing protein n=1 Tax=Cantharellus anzutake TaxID=1750568 RepID=UPI001906B8C5|nr:Sodium/calcium exchanger protein-domain-containing protein [Cantharellus anzutake]KAF8340649.1 Sodium/calcium exchanger protein-domain-containing protein [Cantharellus anzutake]
MRRLLLTLAILLNCFLIWSRESTRFGGSSNVAGLHRFVKRDAASTAKVLADELEATCAQSDTVLSVTYVQKYFCATPVARSFVFAGFIALLMFLFSFIGVAASDFFIPNLASLAEAFGLDDNIAGVTFLAFGNGSPDLFATLSAMRTGSGSLAVGELIGAASFIVSVVAGSMCIITEFKVKKVHFIRDVGFFTAAVLLLITVLYDGLLMLWEALSLVALYICYVAVVVVGSMWQKRRQRMAQSLEISRTQHEQEPGIEILVDVVDDEPYRDDPEEARKPRTPRLEIPWSPRQRSTSLPERDHMLIPPSESQEMNSLSSTSPNVPPWVVAPCPLLMYLVQSLYHFRDVVTSLRRESATEVLAAFESPVSPTYLGGHYHVRPPSLYSSHHPQHSYFDSSRSPSPLSSRRPSSSLVLPESTLPVHINGQTLQIPTPSPGTISTTHPFQLRAVEEIASTKLSRRKGMSRRIARIFHVLTPTLFHLSEKRFLSAAASILAAPAVFMLTVTLPVVVSSVVEGDDDWSVKDEVPEGPLIGVEFDDDSAHPARTAVDGRHHSRAVDQEPEQDISEDSDVAAQPGPELNKYLTAIQLILGPLWVMAIFFGGKSYGVWIELATLVVGISAAVLVLCSVGEGRDPGLRLALCLLGFMVSVVWIMAIADEVVQLLEVSFDDQFCKMRVPMIRDGYLQTLGLIFGLSPAIIGLTIFAVGNSLADFVANVTVASYAPIMGFSACFGGPMLNILLGIGLSGTFVISEVQGGKPYELEFTRTLFISSCGLLGLLVSTLIYVPMNNYELNKKWGLFLICCYVGIMIANVSVEIWAKGSID